MLLLTVFLFQWQLMMMTEGTIHIVEFHVTAVNLIISNTHTHNTHLLTITSDDDGVSMNIKS